ncbi:MAG: bis(5'-nucleosyl)-tetraphosphatase (symmetrical) YqeK [Brevinema sp.]
MSKIQEYQKILVKPYQYSSDLILELQKTLLSEKRFAHVNRVREKAQDIASRCGLDVILSQKIDTAVLLHDFAKGMSSDELETYAREKNISLNNSAPPIFHAIVGAWMAENYFGICDRDILDAVYHHTTGHPKFLHNKVGAVLFLADYLEPGRKHDRTHIDQLIPEDLVKAQYQIVKEKVISVIERDREISSESLIFYEALRQELSL